jgi:hydrogenase maturation protease
MESQMKTLVLGIGNLLLADEGVGVHAARALMAGCLSGVEVQEIGTAILDALPALEKADRVIVLDAMQAQGKPGTIYRIPFEDCEGTHCIASLHGFDLSRVLALANRIDAPSVVVFGVEPGRIEWSMELSPQVAEAVPFLLEAVYKEIKEPFSYS